MGRPEEGQGKELAPRPMITAARVSYGQGGSGIGLDAAHARIRKAMRWTSVREK
jgi:hypothetical protein